MSTLRDTNALTSLSPTFPDAEGGWGSTQGMRKDVPVIQTVEGLLLPLMVDNFGLAAAFRGAELLEGVCVACALVILSFP